MLPARVFLIDIDGLRPDVFASAYQSGRIPEISQLFGGQSLSRGWLNPVTAPAPSITFASQASLFTGAHPSAHGIVGNQLFDRHGVRNRGEPRYYAFDVGDTLAVDDAVRVFTDGLASERLNERTVYEQLSRRGFRCVVAGNMYARGAQTWLKPELTSLARFTKGGNLFGLSAEDYDAHILNKALAHLDDYGLPDILTVYFMGLDHESHQHGPGAQLDYLSRVLDPFIGELWRSINLPEYRSDPPLVALFSDHGQIGVAADDRHSLRLAFPFEREIGHLFDALGLDVHDIPGEDPDCDAVVASNGGLAHVYLQNRRGRWSDKPGFERDVLPVGRAFWDAHGTGNYAAELQGALAGVLVRSVEEHGWSARYAALTPKGELLNIEDWFSAQPDDLYLDPVHRLDNLVAPNSGDLLLISNYTEGYYFGAPLAGVHGGLHPDDSWATMAFGWPGAPESAWIQAQDAIQETIRGRCQAEGGRLPSTTDLVPALLALLG